jgi:hypothetical protein
MMTSRKKMNMLHPLAIHIDRHDIEVALALVELLPFLGNYFLASKGKQCRSANLKIAT